jgi:nitric oxide reductase NorQ protein
MQHWNPEQFETTSEGENSLLIEPKPMKGFVETPQVREVSKRALNYLDSGFPIHFRGPTGAGKTTLGLHVAYKLGRPMLLIHGDDQFTSADLTGTTQGYRRKKVIDEFVRGVSKTEESMQKDWVDHRLTVAVREGYTLLYDEFNRSRPEANNILLSILQEGVLDFPVSGGKGEVYLKVHPEFRIIFTSNPEEYAGVHKTQDALLDRMITIDLDHYDAETETKITAAKAELQENDAAKIVTMIRELRAKSKSGYLPTVRGSIMVGTSVQRYEGAYISSTSEPFRKICHDVLIAEMARKETREERGALSAFLDRLIDKHCGPERDTTATFVSESGPDNEDVAEPKSDRVDAHDRLSEFGRVGNGKEHSGGEGEPVLEGVVGPVDERSQGAYNEERSQEELSTLAALVSVKLDLTGR